MLFLYFTEEYLVRRTQREAEPKKLDEELSHLEASIGARYTEHEIADRVALMTKIKRGTLKANRAERRAIMEKLGGNEPVPCMKHW